MTIANIKRAEEKFSVKVVKDFRKNRSLYLLALPVILFYIIFHYKPMYGAIIAFMDYNPFAGISGSTWVGFKHFKDFFAGPDFWHLIKNTLVISISTVVFSFPLPIILALALNELRSEKFGKVIKTISYLPHFISLVVICGIIKTFFGSNGLIGSFVAKLTGESVNLLNDPSWFVRIYVGSGVWQNIGWDSIIYVAALYSIDQELYEAADIDGCGRWGKIVNITLPCIIPTIVIMLILQLGGMLSVGYQKIILLYNPLTYETADVISSYVYRRGLQEFNYSFSTAVDLFNSVVNFIMIISVNAISKKISNIGII